jgi:hypothetical protein
VIGIQADSHPSSSGPLGGLDSRRHELAIQVKDAGGLDVLLVIFVENQVGWLDAHMAQHGSAGRGPFHKNQTGVGACAFAQAQPGTLDAFLTEPIPQPTALAVVA